MKVKDLQARQSKVDIEIDIVDVGEVRTFEKFGKQGRVCNAIAKDDSGDIKLTLWNEDIDKVKAGDKVKITDGYVSEWQGELQLGTGKYGKLEVIGESKEAVKEETAPVDEAANKKLYEEEKAKIEKKEQEIKGTGQDEEKKEPAPENETKKSQEPTEEQPEVEEEDIKD